MIDRVCFLRWFGIVLAYLTASFFAWYYGVFSDVYTVDVTHITSVIGVIFVISVAYLGIASWRADVRPSNANADAALGRTLAFIVTLVGLLGTSLGLMLQVKAMGSIDVSNVQNVVGFVATIGAAFGTALYCTVSGILASIGITILTSNLEYYLDNLDDHQTQS